MQADTTTLLSDILSKGGPFALIVFVLLALRYASESFSSWRATRRADASTTVVDAAAANATLVDLLRIERAEVARLERRVDGLESDKERLQREKLEQQRAYESEIASLRSTIQEVTLRCQDATIQLEGLQARIRAGLPPS